MKTVFENDKVKISETGRDYDFLAVIQNKTNDKIYLSTDNDEPIEIEADDWIGLTCDNYSKQVKELLKAGSFEISDCLEGDI